MLTPPVVKLVLPHSYKIKLIYYYYYYLYEVVYNPCSRIGKTNYNGAIDVNLDYQIYKTLVQLGHLEVLK